MQFKTLKLHCWLKMLLFFKVKVKVASTHVEAVKHNQ